MKLDKKIIITAIICFLISGTVGVVAYKVGAGDVSFTPENENWQVDNVEEAMNDLYNEKSELTLVFQPGSNQTAFTEYDMRIQLSSYANDFKYFSIIEAEKVRDVCTQIYFSSLPDVSTSNLSINTEYHSCSVPS